MEIFLDILDANGSGDVASTIKDYLDNFNYVPRFGTVVLLLSKTEKESAKEVWKRVGVENVAGAWRGIV